jgi:hypothetical protein
MRTADPASPIASGGLGYSCIAEVRTVETILDGKPRRLSSGTGDTVASGWTTATATLVRTIERRDAR